MVKERTFWALAVVLLFLFLLGQIVYFCFYWYFGFVYQEQPLVYESPLISPVLFHLLFFGFVILVGVAGLIGFVLKKRFGFYLVVFSLYLFCLLEALLVFPVVFCLLVFFLVQKAGGVFGVEKVIPDKVTIGRKPFLVFAVLFTLAVFFLLYGWAFAGVVSLYLMSQGDTSICELYREKKECVTLAVDLSKDHTLCYELADTDSYNCLHKCAVRFDKPELCEELDEHYLIAEVFYVGSSGSGKYIEVPSPDYCYFRYAQKISGIHGESVESYCKKIKNEEVRGYCYSLNEKNIIVQGAIP